MRDGSFCGTFWGDIFLYLLIFYNTDCKKDLDFLCSAKIISFITHGEKNFCPTCVRVGKTQPVRRKLFLLFVSTDTS